MFHSDLATDLGQRLLDRRLPVGHWVGHLSSSALATATAVTALAVASRAAAKDPADGELVARGIDWLVEHRNEDGGWGDTVDSRSNLSTTALGWAALAFGRGDAARASADAAEAWIARAAGGARPEQLASALAERYGKDRTFSVPILTMCAIAGRLGRDGEAWRLVPQLPFEVAALPRRIFGLLRLPVVSYALPALIAMGAARHRRGPRHLLWSPLRDAASPRALRLLTRLQPAGGGFLEAVPLTSFVAMSLVAAGELNHPVIGNGLDFIRRSMREDGSWPIDSNLATWTTTLSVDALASSGGLDGLDGPGRRRIRDWLLAQQWRVEHPYTGAAPGGWAWTDLPGGVPDADDTAGALVALAHLDPSGAEAREAAALGVRWLLDLQNRDGGVPTFCRGWGALPFDRSAADLTAHALRAWSAWRGALDERMRARVDRAIARAVSFLARAQRADGAFVPLWFGSQAEAREENPVLGTSKVLKGLTAIGDRRLPAAARMARRAAAWLLAAQNGDGGWGAGPGLGSSIEETANAVSSLSGFAGGPETAAAVSRGIAWIEGCARAGFRASPVGLYFARLWYAEELYPLIFATDAAGAARRAIQSS